VLLSRPLIRCISAVGLGRNGLVGKRVGSLGVVVFLEGSGQIWVGWEWDLGWFFRKLGIRNGVVGGGVEKAAPLFIDVIGSITSRLSLTAKRKNCADIVDINSVMRDISPCKDRIVGVESACCCWRAAAASA
jgi:hypothetical protein